MTVVMYKTTSLAEFGLGSESPDKRFDFICDKSYWPQTEPDEALSIKGSRHYQLLIYHSEEKRNEAYKNYQAWLKKKRGLS